MFDKLRQIEERWGELNHQLSDPAVIGAARALRPHGQGGVRAERYRPAVRRLQGRARPHHRGPPHPHRGSRPGDARDGPGGDRRPREAADSARGGAAGAAHPARSERRPKRLPGDPRGGGGRRGGAVRRGSLADVQQVRGAAAVEGGGDGHASHRHRRVQGGHPARPGPRRMESAQVRARGAPRPARPRHGVERSHSHLDGHRRGPARGRGRGHQGGGQGRAGRRLPLLRARRPGRQYHGLRRAPHAPAHGPRGDVSGRALPDQEPREGHARAQGAAPRAGPDASRPRPSPRIGGARSERASGASGSGRTTSRRGVSPITGST